MLTEALKLREHQGNGKTIRPEDEEMLATYYTLKKSHLAAREAMERE